MKLLDGKQGLILGMANDRSLAWAIAREVMNEGGRCGFTHNPDPPGDERRKNHRRNNLCISQSAHPELARFLVPLDVQKDEDIAALMEKARQEFGTIDFLVHSIAFANFDDLNRDTIETSREGFKVAMEISVFSFLAVCNAAKKIMPRGASVLAMTHFGGEKCWPGYNVMGICKAALNAAVRYAAFELGGRGVRVNALSIVPLNTFGFPLVPAMDVESEIAPLGRRVHLDELGKSGVFLLCDAANGITGEILHLDGGYNIMGSPGRMLDKIEAAKKGTM